MIRKRSDLDAIQISPRASHPRQTYGAAAPNSFDLEFTSALRPIEWRSYNDGPRRIVYVSPQANVTHNRHSPTVAARTDHHAICDGPLSYVGLSRRPAIFAVGGHDPPLAIELTCRRMRARYRTGGRARRRRNCGCLLPQFFQTRTCHRSVNRVTKLPDERLQLCRIIPVFEESPRSCQFTSVWLRRR